MTKKTKNSIKKIESGSLLFIFYKGLRLFFANPGNIYSGLKYKNISWFFDGFFSEKYVYISNNRYIEALGRNQYFEMREKYENLIKNLDPESKKMVDKYNSVIKTIIQNLDLCVPREMLLFSHNIKSKKIKTNIKQYSKDIKGLEKRLPEIFFYKHGINHIPGIKGYVKQKDIIDCGAFIGDSAFMFSKELDNSNKIFCLEPDKNNFNSLFNNINQNNLQGKIVPINLGVGIKKCELSFDGSKMGVSRAEKLGKDTIKIDTIDNIVDDYKINPGLIKWDIEGLEYDSILGAEKVIKKYRPILIISIYHNPKDFFEIKPLLESWNLGYKFKIVHCEEGISPAEIMLLAYI